MEIRAIDVIIRVVVNALAIGVTAYALPGISVAQHDVPTFLFLGIIIGLVNGFVKPVVKVLAIPITFLTLGLFHFVINALMLLLVSAVDNRLIIGGVNSGGAVAFLWALIGGVIMGIVGGLIEFIAKQAAPKPERKYL